MPVPIVARSRPEILLVGAADRNVGKTEFVCRVIARHASTMPIIGVKITVIPDGNKIGERIRHLEGDGGGVCTEMDRNFLVIEECDAQGTNDTCRMLASGASKVFRLRVMKKHMTEGFEALMALIPGGTAIICESNSARALVEPGAFLVIKDTRADSMKPGCAAVIGMADHILVFDGTGWDFQPDRLGFVDGRWFIRQKATAVILAGGMSTRLGTDKSLLAYRDGTMIGHIAMQLKPMFDELVISSADSGKYGFLDLPVVADIHPGQGPLMGIASALARSRNELCFVMGCDIPVVNFNYVHRMLSMAEGFDIVMPRSLDGKFEPLFAVYRRSVVEPALEILAAGGRRIVELFSRARVNFMEFDSGTWYKNINSPEDYSAITS
ncbi:MAG: molybdenum cofactor guanylyltransferase [Spirochaetes bacterium]|nr:molybdenum cofactor guanylyltransferase [Spirochaetota bacterium]